MPVRSLRSWMELPVARIAKAKPVVVADLSPAALKAVFKAHPFERFPVVIDGKLTGVLTRVEGEAALAAGREPRLDPAVVCGPELSVREVENRLIESPSHIVLIVEEGADGGAVRVISLLTLHDVLRAEILQAREHETE
jgi:chloride channel protein, CIC family